MCKGKLDTYRCLNEVDDQKAYRHCLNPVASFTLQARSSLSSLYPVNWEKSGSTPRDWEHRLVVLTYTGCVFDTSTQKAGVVQWEIILYSDIIHHLHDVE